MRRNDCDLLVLRSGISSSEYRQFLLFSPNARATASAVYARHVYTIYGGQVARKTVPMGRPRTKRTQRCVCFSLIINAKLNYTISGNSARLGA